METPMKPLQLEFEAAKGLTFNAINNIIKQHNLPLFLMETILTEALRQVQLGAQNERAEAERIYKIKLEESRKKAEGGDDDGS